MNSLTPKQNEVLDQVFDLLHEHFDAFAVCYDAADVGSGTNHVCGLQYSGGDAAVGGLLRLNSARFEYKFATSPEDYRPNSP